MNLSELDKELGYSVIQRINEEFNEFKAAMYAGKSLEERKNLDQFFTPPEVTVPLLESLLDSYAEDDKTFSNKDILDPTSGTGNLLMACIIAGAKPTRVYGNDYDATIVKACRARLNKYCSKYNLSPVPEINIHQGNALQTRCLIDFSEEYLTGGSSGCHYNTKYIDDLEYAQSDKSWRWENEHAAKRASKKQQEVDYRSHALFKLD